MNSSFTSAYPSPGKQYSRLRIIGSPVFAEAFASSTNFGANRCLRSTTSFTIFWFPAFRQRQGDAENCIIGQSACTCAERTNSSSENGEPGRNVDHSPPPTMSGQMNGHPTKPAASMSGIRRCSASQLCALSWRRMTTGLPAKPKALRYSLPLYLSANCP